jgi:hypothetical protein
MQSCAPVYDEPLYPNKSIRKRGPSSNVRKTYTVPKGKRFAIQRLFYPMALELELLKFPIKRSFWSLARNYHHGNNHRKYAKTLAKRSRSRGGGCGGRRRAEAEGRSIFVCLTLLLLFIVLLIRECFKIFYVRIFEVGIF